MIRQIRLLAIFTFVFSAGYANSEKVSLNYAREAWFGMSEDICNALRLCAEFEKKSPQDALMKAYFGASSAAATECLGNPAKKIGYFRRGKALIAEAVQMEPDNFEIRFLRFATQSKAPSFLDYDQHIGEDKRFLLANLETGRKVVSNKRIFGLMLEFMIASGSLNAGEKAVVRHASLKAD